MLYLQIFWFVFFCTDNFSISCYCSLVSLTASHPPVVSAAGTYEHLLNKNLNTVSSYNSLNLC